MDSFNVNVPTLALQQDMDPFIAKPWTGISNFPDPHPQTFLPVSV
jgi:hypothetical protein